jgi:hypothetical protein
VEKSDLIQLLGGGRAQATRTPTTEAKRPTSASHAKKETQRPPSASSARPPPTNPTTRPGPTGGGNPSHNLWSESLLLVTRPHLCIARDRLKEMEAKVLTSDRLCHLPHPFQLKRNQRKDPAPPPQPRPQRSDPFEDWTPIDELLAEEAKHSSRFVSKASDVTALEDELLKAQQEEAMPAQDPHSDHGFVSSESDEEGDERSDGTCDSDSEEIQWKPSPTQRSERAPASTSGSPPHTKSYEDTAELSLNIPSHGLGLADEEESEDDEGEDEESIFLNPEMTPQAIKALRLKKFGLNHQPSLSSSSSPDKTISTTSRLQVGVTLLDDEGDDEEADWLSSGDDLPVAASPARRSPSRSANPMASLNSPSATAWMPAAR